MNTIINVGNRIMNTYVFNISSGYVMVDTGYENSYTNVVKKLNKNGIRVSDIKYVFLTHAHDDHAGFLNEMLNHNFELKVIMSNQAMTTLKRGQNSFDGGCTTLLAWLFCKSMTLFGRGEHRFPCIEDKHRNRFIEINGENIKELEELLQGKILFTPGHTKDSISLMKDNMIFCGDAAMNGFPSMKRITIWVENTEQYEQSWETLLKENVEKLYPAHGRPFYKKDLRKYKNTIHKIKLRKLKGESI